MKKHLKKIIFELLQILNLFMLKKKKLDAPNPSGNRISTGFSGGNNSKYYKNFKNKQFINSNDIFGKEFLITDSLEKFDWKITDEQRKIGNYTCNKAQIIIPVTEEDIKEYEEFKKNKKGNKTSFMTISEPKDEIIEAGTKWKFQYQIVPREFWGLPGLILGITRWKYNAFMF